MGLSENISLHTSEIVSRKETESIVVDLYNVICEKCENGYLIDELNGIERVFYLCQTFQYAMNVGGIQQYYMNNFGNFANETVEALLEIQAKATALILDKGNGVFKNGIVPENLEVRTAEVRDMDYSEISWLFDELDREYYEYEDDLDYLCLKYVLENKEAFL